MRLKKCAQNGRRSLHLFKHRQIPNWRTITKLQNIVHQGTDLKMKLRNDRDWKSLVKEERDVGWKSWKKKRMLTREYII